MSATGYAHILILFPRKKYKFENLIIQDWRDARAVEWDGLENRCMGNCTEGSNPSLSAKMQVSEANGQWLGLRVLPSRSLKVIPLAPLSASVASAKEAFSSLNQNLCITFISSDAAMVRTIPDRTENLDQRLKRHQKGYVAATCQKTHLIVIFYCAFQNKHHAFEFERYLKSGSGIGSLSLMPANEP